MCRYAIGIPLINAEDMVNAGGICPLVLDKASRPEVVGEGNQISIIRDFGGDSQQAFQSARIAMNRLSKQLGGRRPCRIADVGGG